MFALTELNPTARKAKLGTTTQECMKWLFFK